MKRTRIWNTKETSPYPDLLTETLEVIEDENDVKFVIFTDNDELKSTSWESFKEIAKDIYYDKGFGSQEINMNLKIVGSNWWLERHEYDGSEWWEYKSMPVKPEEARLTSENILED